VSSPGLPDNPDRAWTRTCEASRCCTPASSGDHLARWVGPDNLRRFAVRFTGQVWPGDELTLTERVERVEAGDGVRLAHLVPAVTRQTGDPATATATAQIG